MLAVYIISPIVLLITLIIILKVRSKRRRKAEWLLELNQWQVGDTVEVDSDTYTKYYCVDHNEAFTASQYYNRAKNDYKQKYPNSNKSQAYVKLIKWDTDNCIIEFAMGEQVHMATDFITKNISYIERTLDKDMDTFVLNTKQRMQKLRRQKLIRVLKENEEDK